MKKKIAMIIVVIFILGLTNTQISTAAIAPELEYPFDNMYTRDQTPYFSWSLGVGISYTIQIDDEDTFATPIIDVNVGLSDTYTVPGDSSLDYGDYYWRVGAHDKGGTAWSEVRLLKIIPVPASPTLLSPTNGSYLIHNELTLDWNAQSYPFIYTCVVKNQPGNDVVDTYGTSNTYVNLSLVDGSYSWLVYIQDPMSPTDYYTSSTWTFTIDTEPLPAPILEFPINDEFINTIYPSLQWSYVPGAQSYCLIVNDNPDFTLPIINQSSIPQDICHYVPNPSPLDDYQYYWTVSAIDKAGNMNYADFESFRIDRFPPLCPTPTSPGGGQIIDDPSPTLSWLSSEAYYHIGLGDTLECSDYGGGTENNYISLDSLGISLQDGLYYWKVMAVDEAGNPGPYSVICTFVVDTTSPQIITLDDISYVEGTNENTISWTVSDENPDFYTIYRDGVEIATDIWDSNTITINIDGLAAGEYEYMIIVTDACGHTNSDTVIVTVTLSIPELRSTSFAIPIIIIAFPVILQFLRKKKRKLVR